MKARQLILFAIGRSAKTGTRRYYDITVNVILIFQANPNLAIIKDVNIPLLSSASHFQ